jgi:serine/threonine protein kinase
MPQKLGSYDVYGTLGKGKFARVRFAVNRVTNSSFAIKIIDKMKLRENGSLEDVKNEIAIVKTIDSKYCVGIRDMFANTEKIFLVIDLMMGGTLAQKLKKRGKLSEERSRFYIQQIFLGMEYCHKMGVIVGGLSLESILLDRENNVKISDFGYATLESCALPTATGNRSLPQYLSPELVNEVYHVSQGSDLWAFAVIVYALTAGYLPFEPTSGLPDLYRRILAAAYDPFPVWFSAELCELLSAMLQRDASQRLSVAEVRAQPWMKWDTTDFGIEVEDDEDDDDELISRGPNGYERAKPIIPDPAEDSVPVFACLNIIPDVFQVLWTPMEYINIPNPLGARKVAKPPPAPATTNGKSNRNSKRRSSRNSNGSARDAYTYDPSDYSASAANEAH